MTQLTELTQRQPLRPAKHWSGEIEHKQDNIGLIEFWYRIRCCVVHGEVVNRHYVYLAYKTLHLFLSYIKDIHSSAPTKI